MPSAAATINERRHHQETVMDTQGSPDLDQRNDANIHVQPHCTVNTTKDTGSDHFPGRFLATTHPARFIQSCCLTRPKKLHIMNSPKHKFRLNS